MNFRSGNPAPRRQSSRAVYPLLLVFAVQTAGPGTALADEPILEEVVVEGRRLVLTGQARSASEGVIGQVVHVE